VNYEDLVEELVSTIRLGYEAEGEHPAFAFQMPAGDEVAWLAAWIISEGWRREPGWASRTGEWRQDRADRGMEFSANVGVLRDDVRMEAEEQDPGLFVGRHVVEVGRRQAWPFVNLADPESGREVRLYLDTDFSVTPAWSQLDQDNGAALAALESLNGLTITSADLGTEGLGLGFGEICLRVAQAGNRLTSHSPWWVGTVAP
jgi:hypothetical protein